MPSILPIRKPFPAWSEGLPSSRRGIGLLLALLLHAGVFLWLTNRPAQEQTATAPPPIALMLLPSDDPASVATPERQPDKIKQIRSAAPQEKAEPKEAVKSVEAPNPEIVVAKKARHRAITKPQPVTPHNAEVPPAPAPPAPETHAPASHPQQSAGRAGSSAVSAPSPGEVNWVGLLRQRLDRFKRYPAQALRQQAQGVVYLSLTLNREGQVLSVVLAKSSGTPTLDREALALPARATPLPAPTEDIAAGQPQITLTLPIRFDLRQ
ncbi:TonB family C-terminal domain [Cedecea lapagei]|uniref:TonB family C-terminal domain n=1 Tax=Cedecea lapagei TaxID=158823 RepID=A0A447UWB9_9ENTR|nr:TonB family protein [Cedecea lapagei]VEB94997.1 TonB family C-terminal domain [Cedecea lapagei]